MAQTVSSKLLILFGLVCGTFFFAESGFAAPVANKSSSFSTKMSANTKSSTDTTDSAIANKIRAQRAALDARDAQDNVARKNAMGVDSNGCDSALRKCITARCNGNYSKCATDTDTIFSDKLNACRKNANCTAHEFTLFSNQIKEDKKQEISLAAYNNVLECGNSYNNCIIAECGTKFNKCLGKTAGDKAIAKCKQIATDCTEADSGLVGRIGTVFGIVRQDAEKQIAADENKLRDLRKQMRTTCEHLGSGVMFDERSLDCVYTISFYAGDDMTTPKASKKAYAGSVFDCSPDWFGIDITTFKENAYRLTRSQTAASSAMLGSGVGTAVGAITSGAIGRAIDTKKAKDELKQACKKNGQIFDSKLDECRDMTEAEKKLAEEEEKKKEERLQRKAERKCLSRVGKNIGRDALAKGFTKNMTEEDGAKYADDIEECWDDEEDGPQTLTGKIISNAIEKKATNGTPSVDGEDDGNNADDDNKANQ